MASFFWTEVVASWIACFECFKYAILHPKSHRNTRPRRPDRWLQNVFLLTENSSWSQLGFVTVFTLGPMMMSSMQSRCTGLHTLQHQWFFISISSFVCLDYCCSHEKCWIITEIKHWINFFFHFISLDLLLLKSCVCAVSHKSGLKCFNGLKTLKMTVLCCYESRTVVHKNYKSFKATGLTVAHSNNRFWVSYYFKTLKNSAKVWEMWRWVHLQCTTAQNIHLWRWKSWYLNSFGGCFQSYL